MTYTMKSWNNTNPEQIDGSRPDVIAAAEARAKHENAVVRLRDDKLQMVLDVHPDGYLSKWADDSPYTHEDALNDAIDALEDC